MTHDIETRLQALEDHHNLKTLVDTFANLADRKDFASQMLLFTEDAVVETYFGDTLFASMKGRSEIESVSASFIASFEQMFHMNGQFTAGIDVDRASAAHYCNVTLTSGGDGEKKSMNSNGSIYHDDYVRTDDGWLISKRIARFTWRNTAEMAA